MSARRYLVVNADDFGMSAAVNRGVVEAHDRGIVTSASLLVRHPAAEEAAALASLRPGLGLGLHLDLGNWRWDGATWRTVYSRADPENATAVAAEIDRQLEIFGELTLRPLDHLDSHQNVHLREPVLGLMEAAARRLGVPLRGRTAGVRYCGAFYGRTGHGSPLPAAIQVDALVRILTRLDDGVTELGCHPASGGDVDDAYGAERLTETRTLCAPSVRTAVEAYGISLCNFTHPGVMRCVSQ